MGNGIILTSGTVVVKSRIILTEIPKTASSALVQVEATSCVSNAWLSLEMR